MAQPQSAAAQDNAKSGRNARPVAIFKQGRRSERTDEPRRERLYVQPNWLRFIPIPGLTDNDDDIAKIARFAASLGNIERVDVLPFHQMG